MRIRPFFHGIALLGSLAATITVAARSPSEEPIPPSPKAEARADVSSVTSRLPPGVMSGSSVLHLKHTLENGVRVQASILLEPPAINLVDRQRVRAGTICRPISAVHCVDLDDLLLGRYHELELCAVDSNLSLSTTFTVFPALGTPDSATAPGFDVSVKIVPRDGLSWGSVMRESDVVFSVSGETHITVPMQHPKPLKDSKDR